jgi:hypothetical protein
VKQPPTDEQGPQFRPGEKEGIRRAALLNGRPLSGFAGHYDQYLQYLYAPPRLRGARASYVSIILGSLLAGYTDRFFAALRYRPDLLQDPNIWEFTIGRWFEQKLDPDKKVRDQARKYLPQVGKSLAYVRQGKWRLNEKEQKAIIADCKRWRPICEGLNEAFKRLWKQSEYESSGLHRKEARGELAGMYGISVKEVETIERVLKTPSRKGNKSTPTEAMLQMVALDHVDRGVKMIEQIWGEYLDKHPGERSERRKSTTQAASHS